MNIVSRMQCITCRRRLAYERARDGSDPQVCVGCRAQTLAGLNIDFKGTAGIPLAEEEKSNVPEGK